MYFNHTHDMILFTETQSYTSANPPPGWPLPPATAAGLPRQYSYKNFSRVADKGVELSLDVRIAPSMTAFVNYTWQDDPETDFEVTELGIPPTHHVNAGVGYSQGRYFGSASVSYQDEAYWQDVTPYRGWTSPYTVVNVSAGLRSSDGAMTAAVRVTNMLNDVTQQHIFGDFLKRTVTGEIRLAF
jgi:outer membrane receptor protein involved in Fe transport